MTTTIAQQITEASLAMKQAAKQVSAAVKAMHVLVRPDNGTDTGLAGYGDSPEDAKKMLDVIRDVESPDAP